MNILPRAKDPVEVINATLVPLDVYSKPFDITFIARDWN
jgi:hypothetical protein